MNIWKTLSEELTHGATRAAPHIFELAGARAPGSATMIRREGGQKGRAVTAAHLMGRRDEGQVRREDGEIYPARVIGRDAATDIALLEIDSAADGLSAADAPAVGALTLALARRGGQLALSAGFVAERDEAFITRGGGTFAAYIEVGTTLPRGYSGGPLIDADGALIGMNTHGVTRGGTTVDVATVHKVADLLETHGHVARGHLGIQVQPAPMGTLVTGVAPGAPAHGAGVHVGDILTGLDGHKTPSPAALLWALTGTADRTVAVTLRRDGADVTLEVQVAAQPTRRPKRGARRRGPK